MRKTILSIYLVVISMILICSCKGNSGNFAAIESEEITLIKIEIIPEENISFENGIPQGTLVQYSAIGVYDNNTTKDITIMVSWSSLDESVIEVGNDEANKGLVSGVGVGSTAIKVTDPSSGIYAGLDLRVIEAALLSIRIKPGNSSLGLGDTLQYSAEGTFSDNSIQNITEFITWTSSDDKVAAVSNDDGTKGVVTGVGIGSTIIEALETYNNLSVSTELEVVERTFSITGTITGDVSSNVLIVISGDTNATTTLSPDGSYSFNNLSAGSFIITPQLDNYTFSPQNYSVLLSGSNIEDVDFVGTQINNFLNSNPPSYTVRLVFVHHSCGNNWLNANNGNLGNLLGDNNYYVRDTYYGWDAPLNSDIGDLTDIGHWYLWFADTTIQENGSVRRDNIMTGLYNTNNQNAIYTPIDNPGGENDIIMFKSCYPNSDILNDNSTSPEDLYGRYCTVNAHTLSNCKEVYRQILQYFKTRPNKMFIIATAPPLVESVTDEVNAANARTFNTWLVNNWLQEAGWYNRNVYVFDLFNVLTAEDNHHRFNGSDIQYINSYGNNYAEYGEGTDSHPNVIGNQKATYEFIPLLNVYYHLWQEWLETI